MSDMNDPYILALNFKIQHGESYDYSKAPPMVVSTPHFDISVEDENARFVFKTHYATERDARDAVENYIRAWELDIALHRGPDAFKLVFDRAELHDRNPTPGVIAVAAGPLRFTVSVSEPKVTVFLGSYPSPPTPGLKSSPDVESMFNRYIGYLEGSEPLASMAYFCLTVLLSSEGGDLSATARRYSISSQLLKRIRVLASTKGGSAARKATGVATDLTTQETRFLEGAVKTIIRRAAELEFDRNASMHKITIADI